jgi:bifunctional DNA-binding transcriptional regulator/antitoxin component of YhaV-PrlF toxin-antitoxin module
LREFSERPQASLLANFDSAWMAGRLTASVARWGLNTAHLYTGGNLSAVVESDEKGRILLPIEMRRKLKSKRFKVIVKGDFLELHPLVGIEELRGKYRGMIHSEWEDLEDKAEEMVSHGAR